MLSVEEGKQVEEFLDVKIIYFLYFRECRKYFACFLANIDARSRMYVFLLRSITLIIIAYMHLAFSLMHAYRLQKTGVERRKTIDS